MNLVAQRVAVQASVMCSVPDCQHTLEAQAVVEWPKGEPAPIDMVYSGQIMIGVARSDSVTALLAAAAEQSWVVGLTYVLCSNHRDAAASAYLRAANERTSVG